MNKNKENNKGEKLAKLVGEYFKWDVESEDDSIQEAIDLLNAFIAVKKASRGSGEAEQAINEMFSESMNALDKLGVKS